MYRLIDAIYRERGVAIGRFNPKDGSLFLLIDRATYRELRAVENDLWFNTVARGHIFNMPIIATERVKGFKVVMEVA